MKEKIIKILLVMLIALGINTISSKAAISGNSQTVNSGDNVTITITSDKSLASYKVSVSDEGGLTYVNCSDLNGGQSGNKNIAGSPSSGTNKLGTFTFKAPTVTSDTKYTIKFKATAMETPDLETIPDSTATVNITVKAPEEKPTEKPEEKPVENTKSSNNKLKNLGIRPNDFTTFKPGTTTYYITVPNDVSEVEVYAEKQESSQKISGTGTVKLKEGSNTVRVVCTAEDGTTKTYTMYITREKVEEEANTAEENQTEEPTNNEEQPTEETQENIEQTVEKVLGITNLNITAKTENGETIKTELSPAFMENQDEYQLTVPLNVVDLEITVETQDGTAEVEVMGNKNLAEGENIVTVIVKVGEETKIYQITVNKTAVTGASALSNEVIMQLAAIAAIATVIIVVIIALIIMIIRSKKKTKKQTKPAINTEIAETSNIESNNEEKEEIYNK